MRHLPRFIMMLLATGALASCTEAPPATAPDDAVDAVQPTLGSAHLACDLTQAMAADVRNFFVMPTRQTASDKMRQLGNACSSGNHLLTQSLALELLNMMEVEINRNAVGDAAAGGRLARSLLACTTDPGCTSNAFVPYAIPAASVLTTAISNPAGMFLVRGSDNRYAIARGNISFNDDLGRPNGALFGAEVSSTWAAANGTPFLLIYGYPVAPTFVREGTVANNVGYSFNRWPNPGNFTADGLVHVGACFNLDVGFAHAPGEPDPKGRMQREGTILSLFQPTFCPPPPPAPLTASILAPAKLLAAALFPRTWSTMAMADIRTPVIGGSPIGWSDFAPVGANVAGRLVIVNGPKAVYAINEPLMIRVRAESGGGTPMELVPVQLYVTGNSGTPAGAVVAGTDWGYTAEGDGTYVFSDASLGKAGGYTLCARLKADPGFPGFTFTEACTGLFHVR